MTLNQIINAYKAGLDVSKADFSTLTVEEKREFVNQLFVDEELFLNAMPESLDDLTIAQEIDANLNWRENYSNMLLKNSEIFNKFITNTIELERACKECPEKRIELITKYSSINDSIEKIVNRIVSINFKFSILYDTDELEPNRAAERCSLIKLLNQKIKENPQQVPKTPEGERQLRLMRNDILDFEKTFPELRNNPEWEKERTKFLDFCHWRLSTLVNATVGFLKKNLENKHETLNKVIGLVPSELKDKLSVPIKVSNSIEEKCASLNELKEKLNYVYEKLAKDEDTKSWMTRFIDGITRLEKSATQLKNSKEWLTEETTLFDSFNERYSDIVFIIVDFLKRHYSADTLNLITRDIVSPDLKQKLETPTVNQSIRPKIT